MKINIPKEPFLRLLVVLALVSWKGSVVAQITLPKGAETCPNSKNQKIDFAKWWGNAQVNGPVEPPNNLTFAPTGNCDFYMIAERMFLWLTSPAPRDNLHVFEMPIFYQVSPADPQKTRELLINSADLNKPNPNNPADLTKLKKASVSITQFNEEGDAVALDSKGKMYSFMRQERSNSGAPLIRNRYGQQFEIERTEVARNGGPLFLILNKFGKPIPFKGTPDELLHDSHGQEIHFDLSFKKFFVNGQPFFLDRPGTMVIETERGAASQPVLMAHAGNKLVYYTIEVNDVYAYFLTGTKTVLPDSTTPVITETHFPVISSVLWAVEAFAGRKFPNPEVLAVEIKFAWIEAAGLRNIENYIRTWANIPKYDETDPKHWVRNGWKPAELALVGMHVAFSAKNHKEMIWATFEHVNNARNPAYSYGDHETNPPSTGRAWLFSSKEATARSRNINCERSQKENVNIKHMYLNGGDIYALPDNDAHQHNKIEPSNVLRINPWGFEPCDAANNTDVISINNSVHRKLVSGDVRKNYIMIGATWLLRDNASQEGAKELANTTMETFFQGMKGPNFMNGCLGCHQGSAANMLGAPNGGVSHIYCVTSPLPNIPSSSTVPGPGCGDHSSIAPSQYLDPE